MKKSVLQICSALALLATIAIAAPHPTLNPNLKNIIDTIKHYNHTLVKELYVESVENLTQGNGRCGAKFFCKVEAILEKHWKETQHKHIQDEKLARDLKVYNTNKKCSEVLKQVQSATVNIQMPKFLEFVEECIQCRNLNISKPSCSE